MIKITVKFSAQIKQAAGVPSKIIELEHACPVKDLLLRLAQEHGGTFRQVILDSEGRPKDTILVFVDDTHVLWNDPEPLKDGDVISLMAPVSGG